MRITRGFSYTKKTYGGQFSDILIWGPKTCESYLLRELRKGVVSKQGHMAQQFVTYVSGRVMVAWCRVGGF